jgi:Raf kinase inhibitor-like YbhB/YbcL family protein
VQTSETFVLQSTAFQDGGAIPKRFTCDGDDVSPDLTWSGAPDDTVALALILDDPDARGFVHWVVFDMTGSASGGLPEGVSATPDAPPQGLNDFRKIGYNGPCPPSGTHQYVFTLYALDDLLGLTRTPRAQDVRDAMNGHVLGTTTLRATFRR